MLQPITLSDVYLFIVQIRERRQLVNGCLATVSGVTLQSEGLNGMLLVILPSWSS